MSPSMYSWLGDQIATSVSTCVVVSVNLVQVYPKVQVVQGVHVQSVLLPCAQGSVPVFFVTTVFE